MHYAGVEVMGTENITFLALERDCARNNYANEITDFEIRGLPGRTEGMTTKSKAEELLELAAMYAGDGAFVTAIDKATEAIDCMKAYQRGIKEALAQNGVGTTPGEIRKRHLGRNCECPYCCEPTLRDTGFDDPPSLR